MYYAYNSIHSHPLHGPHSLFVEMSNKRSSTAAQKPPTSLAKSVIISEQASLIGINHITVGANTVIHPRSKLNSMNVPISIGNNCIISERCRIGLQGDSSTSEVLSINIENGVIIETGAVVEASIIGEGCILEVNSKIGKGAILGKFCKIGPSCEVIDKEIIPDFTVIYGTGQRRIDTSGIESLKLKMVAKQIDVLRKLIPSSVAHFN
ncbi:BgTH12-07073 [Blumeria graminis f. sp. triticale]|uniref:Dynactin subunit 6 n=3 Tax=Blumeria graminis TaxID=34373 RepID=A0A061HEL0_BLUGR|nr:hypothetical protein BGT96224_3111 [Blumeria graminis f. sp. tritici 96224]CAD6506143.1 BgTH12-07073 [Blumeria graminis f. sp. triticale]VDB94838.1 Bgt-3111 [Blumeria graminis f. sp. tritici]